MSLVTNSSERTLLQEARDPAKMEASTAKFWMAILHREFPAARQLYPVQEQPPGDEGRRRVDGKVYCIENGNQRDFLYVEFKRANLPGSKLKEAVQQVEAYVPTCLFSSDSYGKQMTYMMCYGSQAYLAHAQRTVMRFSHPPYNRQNFLDADSPGAAILSAEFRRLERKFGK